ncbi:MAG: YbaK/EbsC family protein [Acidimicrobiia bacterium]|nr:YbaK/EbsC family protein [Acidimicrobiia bacterium]MDH3462221.1 YbaK/EbsC family protein [Acidimicrobiia bacterium]
MADEPALQDDRLEGVSYHVVRHGPVASLEEAATLRGVDPSSIVKTIVVRKEDADFAFVLVPGDRIIAWPKLRSVLGVNRISMPSAETALDATGYVRGTITPFGASHRWPVIADSLVAGGTVSIGAGAHGVSLTMPGPQLVRCLNAAVADVTKPSPGELIERASEG